MSSLTELKELADKATPGPWWVGWGDGSGASSIVAREHEDALGLRAIVVMGGDHDGVDMGVTSPADARYIAACSPEVVKALIAVAEIAERVDDARSPAIGLLNDLSAALDHLKGVLK